MDNFYTVRQVQEILKVDRITVYRMLGDGRLKGIKIGQQWRFAASEVQRLFSTDSIPVSSITSPDNGFPTHCVQTIQNLYADISQLPAIVVDMRGEPLTAISRPYKLIMLLQESSAGKASLTQDWRAIAEEVSRKSTFTASTGLQYIAAPIIDRGEQIGAFISGEFYFSKPDRYEESERAQRLASLYKIDISQLQEALLDVPVVPLERRSQVESWPRSAAQAVQSILSERTSFINRLQQIADLTQIS